MKSVNFEDVPKLCDQILHEIDTAGVCFEVIKDGRPIARLEPVDEATKARFAAKAKKRR